MQSTDTIERNSWLLAASALALILYLRLLIAFLAGLLVFELVRAIAPALQRHFPRQRSRIVALAMLASLIMGAIAAAVLGVVEFGEGSGLSMLLQKMAEILENARTALPLWLLQYLPGSIDDVRAASSQWLREHASQVQVAGAETGRAVAHLLIGMVVGGIVSLRQTAEVANQKPLAAALERRAERITNAFRSVVFAQVRISLLNTAFTAIYVLVALPLVNVDLPLAKTLVVVTFVAGLLPVVGNLISNTIIVVVSLSSSIYVAAVSLAFLIVIHKLEYLLNARIVGVRIQAQPWELLIAMLAMESAFGIPGLVAAPIYYAYLKAELADRSLV